FVHQKAKAFSRTARAQGPQQSGSLLDTLEVHSLTIGNNQVQNANARFVDVIFNRLGLAVQERKAHQTDNRRKKSPSGAVHRFGNTFSENTCLLTGVD